MITDPWRTTRTHNDMFRHRTLLLAGDLSHGHRTVLTETSKWESIEIAYIPRRNSVSSLLETSTQTFYPRRPAIQS